jgi:tetratricopeptide (TPR) repeat protein
MLELCLQRTGDHLTVALGEHSATFPLAEIVPGASNWQRIYDDAVAYGRDLFDHTFRDEPMRALLANLPANERLVLVAEDPLIANIPWEYLRDQNGKLLAARLNVVRSLPEERRRESFSMAGPLEIVAIPVSPVDEQRVLNTEREWRDLVKAVTVTSPPKSLTLKRVRPPTLTQMERSPGRQGTSIIHFMGHSASRDGKAFLVFEDARARSYLVDAADFADSLHRQVLLVVLNSCLSATVSSTESGTVTEFGNIARMLVDKGVPYALGMQFIVPDTAALVLSRTLYDFLLQQQSVEEAVMHTRRALEEPGKLPNPHWLAGIPVLYTSLRTPAPPLELATEHPAIQPDPVQLEHTCDLIALPPADHFLGRGNEISQALDELLASGAQGFVLLHGLGGIGKTATARAVAERVSWHYQDRVLAYSFETFASVDLANQLTVNEQFADRFYNRLARFYGLDPAQYPFPVDLQHAILQRRAHFRSLLVLDNIETLIDAQRRNHPAAIALASFISRLKEGDGAVLFTSRMVTPSDWGECEIVSITGLPDESGAALFLALLPADREHLAPFVARQALNQRVQGHPLSIRLLAGRFADESATDLRTFLEHIEGELEAAEQTTPTSIEDPERQRTLYACIDYSVKRLTLEQRKVLDAASLFQAPFLPQFVADVLNDEEQTPIHLQNLVRLSLLEISAQTRTFQEGELVLLELHPMLRWYIQHRLQAPDTELLERYGEVYAQLARTTYDEYDRDSRLRYLVRQSLPDFEAALGYLLPARRSSLAYYLAKPYERLGQNRRSLSLYEQALEIDQDLGDVRSVAVTQSAMADVLVQQGKPQEAMALYEQALHTKQDLGDVREVAVTQANFCQLLFQQGEHQRALSMAWEAYTSLRQSGFAYDAQVMQQLLISIKGQVPGPSQFDALWVQVMHQPQPDWLRDVRANMPNKPNHLSPEQLRIIVANTITVMTTIPEKRDEWLGSMTNALQQAQQSNQSQDIEFITAILAVLDGQSTALPEDHPYAAALEEIQSGIAAGGLQSEESLFAVSDEVVQAVRDFVKAEDWDASRQVVEAQQEVLFQPEVETLFEQNIARARTTGNQRTAEMLELHLALLRECKTIGIVEAFERLSAEEEDALPFDAELIPRSIAALLGGPQKKMEHVQYLNMLASQATDEDLKALIAVIQLALFEKDLSQLGRNLKGVYQQAWEAIVVGVESGGVDPRVFDAIIHNTLAVLGPASHQRSEWRNNLVELRNQSTAMGDRNMAALLDAVIGLLDAGGNPGGLGVGLKGIYARTWQEVVGKLGS